MMANIPDRHTVGNQLGNDLPARHETDERDAGYLEDELLAQRGQPTGLHVIAHDLGHTEKSGLQGGSAAGD